MLWAWLACKPQNQRAATPRNAMPCVAPLSHRWRSTIKTAFKTHFGVNPWKKSKSCKRSASTSPP